MRAAWPARDAPVAALVEARRCARRIPEPAGSIQWEEAGPSNIGGRITCAVAHSDDPKILWAGGAGGGVWKTVDAGFHWKPLWRHQLTLNVGALAVDPGDPDTLYCGTGEANQSCDSYAGVGLYSSSNGGLRWKLLAGAVGGRLPPRIGTISIDPFDSKHLLVGGIGCSQKTPGGLFTSRDSGRSWHRENFVSSRNYWCHSIVFDPHRDREGTIFAAFTELGARNGIWRSQDGGISWEQLVVGLPPSDELGRITLALAPSDSRRIYAMADWSDQVVGFFRSDNGGSTWQDLSGEHFWKERQMSYNQALAVHPEDADKVLCGGVELHLSDAGGESWSWRQATDEYSHRGRPNSVHPDQHAIVWHPRSPDRIYAFNDGGLDVSEDLGRTWENRSMGLAVTQYYDVDIAQSDARRFGGGTQDNGTLLTLDGERDRHFEVYGGDGGWMVIDPTDADHFYASAQYMDILRFRGFQRAEATPKGLEDWEMANLWMAFIAMDHSNPLRLFTGSTRIWRTLDDGESWTAVSESLDGSVVTAIEIARADPLQIYVGTEYGGFFRSVDGGESWSAALQGAELPGRTITRIRTDPQKADEVYVTVANFGNSHVFYSPDQGSCWEDIDGGRLPDAPCNAVEIVEGTPDKLIVASDVGVFASANRGRSWVVLSRDLPHVPCTDCVYHQDEEMLLIATYGRGLWKGWLPRLLDT